MPSFITAWVGASFPAFCPSLLYLFLLLQASENTRWQLFFPHYIHEVSLDSSRFLAHVMGLAPVSPTPPGTQFPTITKIITSSSYDSGALEPTPINRCLPDSQCNHPPYRHQLKLPDVAYTHFRPQRWTSVPPSWCASRGLYRNSKTLINLFCQLVNIPYIYYAIIMIQC